MSSSSSVAVRIRVQLLLVEGLVGEPDVAELDAAGVVAGDGSGGRDDRRLGVEEFEDALAGGHGGLQDVVLSLRSWMGRKKRCAYWMKAMRMPMVTTCRRAAVESVAARLEFV